MPCFHGLAVSIHTPDGPLPEYSIQKQSRFHRITTYIPVPPAKVPSNSTTNKPEQSTFAISITLLTPGLNVPYSTPKPTLDDLNPRANVVGGMPGWFSSLPSEGGGSNGNAAIVGSGGSSGSVPSGVGKSKSGPVIGPYLPMTQSPNETIAAYIYFDGRAKEEVATLLRRGEETWVNSRWVSVPDSEGGGLAEREFLFREVGLERWLNGLDLEGKDVAARIERRKQRLEKKRRKKRDCRHKDEGDVLHGETDRRQNGVLRYGNDKNAPVECLSGDDGLFTTDSDSEDEPPTPEAAGQIKVALFRVLASGEIKRGEYSPQFDAHDDDDASQQNEDTAKGDTEVDHTTSFAKPKTLDPKSISTQTVTGIDPPEKPYAVFTFLYRGERQLQKMGILPKAPQNATSKTPTSVKRSSIKMDFSKLNPLNPSSAKNFVTYRDPAVKSSSPKFLKNGKSAGRKKTEDHAMDSDADDDSADELFDRAVDDDDKSINGMLSPEDAIQQGELAEGVRKIKLKRQHSAEPMTSASRSPAARNNSENSNSSCSINKGTPNSTSPLVKSGISQPPQPSGTILASSFDSGISTVSPPSQPSTTYDSAIGSPPSKADSIFSSTALGLSSLDSPDQSMVGSPYKKQRASLSCVDERLRVGVFDGLFSKGYSFNNEDEEL